MPTAEKRIYKPGEYERELGSGGYVVRNAIYGSGKYHLPTTDGKAALCGKVPSCSWTIRASRAELERVAPERVCKRCLTAEAKSLPQGAHRVVAGVRNHPKISRQ